MKIINIVGARPNFMKIAPIMHEYKKYPQIEPLLVHTGQHYSEEMSDLFFQQLKIPKPDVNLGIGSASHAVQTAEIMVAFEPLVLEHQPDAVLVVGDVNSTIACGLVAVKLGVKLIHVEAGLRSNDWSMPEEINRILTDSISDILFCTESSGVDNLIREGKSPDDIFMVGNVMIDTLLKNKQLADQSNILNELELAPEDYYVLTLHRPSNVDNPVVLSGIFDALEEIQKDMRIVFPVHPRTLQSMQETGLNDQLAKMENVHTVKPLSYLDFLKLMSSARLVLTDSGGIQEETTILGVSCLTLRENTERPVTITQGTNRLAGTNPSDILAAYGEAMTTDYTDIEAPALWDGRGAERIVDIIAKKV